MNVAVIPDGPGMTEVLYVTVGGMVSTTLRPAYRVRVEVAAEPLPASRRTEILDPIPTWEDAEWQ